MNTNGPLLLIIADDLTGAADTTARCHRAGLRSQVLLDPAQWPAAGDQAPVLAIPTDSRHLPPEAAAARVQEVLSQAPPLPNGQWYKKIDSTLRGNIGAELDAMLAWLGETVVAVVSPAFPAQGRGLEDGYLVHAQTPPRQAHLPSLLAGQSKLPVAAIPLEVVRQGQEPLAQALAQAAAGGARLLVVDGLSDADLATLAQAAQRALEAPLFCGSAGLVGVLATALAQRVGVQAALEPATPLPAPGPILAIVGSASPMAHAQIARVAARPDVRIRTLDRTWSQVDLVTANGHPTGHWLLHLAPPPTGTPLAGATARVEAARLADLSHAAIGRLHPAALIIVGGDTATYVMRVLGVTRLEVVEELLPGIPLLTGTD
ncbi:MAG TPA: four-carbon acid sugar kinase family protein, partial [Caldilineaceae bacterium]|nr:four-carbon acid sugar kinase family protein [Caldilineaceae bacterium]